LVKSYIWTSERPDTAVAALQCQQKDGRIFLRQIFYSTTAKDYFGSILIKES